MSILHLLRSDAHLNVNKSLARQIGLNAAILYGEVLSKWNYFKTRDELTDDGFFYNTVENMQHDTTLGRKQQQDAVKLLVELNLIEYKVSGMPAKRFFKVNEDEEVILNLLRSRVVDQSSENLQTSSPDQFAENLRTGSQKNDEQVRTKPALNNNNSNKTKDNNNGKDVSASATSQRTLIDLPSKQERMSRSEIALHKISEARAGRVSWSEVNDTNFTYYYIDLHNRLFKNEISFKDGRDVSMLKKGLIERYNLPRHFIADVIDKLLKSFSNHPKNERDMLGLIAIENDYLPKGFVQSVVREVIPIERKYNRERTVETEKIELSSDVF